jgi:hypothetical protein
MGYAQGGIITVSWDEPTKYGLENNESPTKSPFRYTLLDDPSLMYHLLTFLPRFSFVFSLVSCY